MNINVSDPYELEILTTIAKNNKLSVEQYATNIVRGWIQEQIRGLYIDHVRKTNIDTIKQQIGKLSVKEE